MFKVLIAEDDSVTSKILERHMREWGYEVTITRNGEEAWKAFKDKKIRLAVLDWMMPKIDGLELCRKIRRQKGEKYLYIILLTSKDGHEDTIKGLNAGADDYIEKPVDIKTLIPRVRRFIV